MLTEFDRLQYRVLFDLILGGNSGLEGARFIQI